MELAPYHAALISLARDEKEKGVADQIYSQLTAAGVEVLYDDRDDVRAGEKFGDADLIGLPFRIIVSGKTLAQSGIEFKERSSAESAVISVPDAVARIKSQLAALRQ